MSRYEKTPAESEIKKIKRLCNNVNINYDEIQLEAEYDNIGNILSISTNNAKLKTILENNGFTNV